MQGYRKNLIILCKFYCWHLKETKVVEEKTIEKSYNKTRVLIIANKFHVSVTALKNKNNLKTDLIRPGQTIKIP